MIRLLRTALVCSLLAVALLPALPSQATLLMKPVADADLVYTGSLLNHNYNPAVSKPEVFLGFSVGQRVATPEQIADALGAWSTQSDRINVVEYARTHEGRPLFAVYISAASNLARLDAIQTDISLLADARKIDDSQAQEIISRLPATAWMAYSIHGNETSGADAALASIYHLIASTDPGVTSLLENMVVVIDPMMNPDGRARFAKSLEQYRGTAPNVDDQSLLHTGDWPYGRTNHYFFDLNRDFYFLTQPETRGRVALINQWRPQLMIDGHEQGSQDTYLMGPPRQPLNKNIDADLQKWARVFSIDQGAAFDDRGWRYYTGEWFENLYPGYSNYAEYRGSVHILYEQSRMAEDGVRRPEGTVQTYKESVHHQFVSTMANLNTLAKHSKAMYQDYWEGRKYNVSPKSEFANRNYVVLANSNAGRMEALVDVLTAQGIELYQNQVDVTIKQATDLFGKRSDKVTIPAGSLVVPNRQPEAPLIAAIMEFDADIEESVFVEERQQLLRDGSSILYDTTAWNLSMMYGLPSLTVEEELSTELKPWQLQASEAAAQTIDSNANAWWVNGEDDRSVAFAARLMEQSIEVRVLNKATEFSGSTAPRGSVFVTAMDNPKSTDIADRISREAQALGLPVSATRSGYGAGELPDWGGEHFPLLNKPQIAILSHAGFSSYDVGVSWWGIDTYLGIRHSQIDAAYLSYADLRRYNTIIMPNGYRPLSDTERLALKDWVKQGGTLIAHSQSAGALASEDGLGSVRVISDTFERAAEYDIALQRQRLSTSNHVDMQAAASPRVDTQLPYPWDPEVKVPDEKELKKRDTWQSLFMPSGAMVAGRVDNQHWLTFGTPDELPLLYAKQPVLMTDGKAEAVIRVGVFRDAKQEPAKNTDKEDEEASTRVINWSTLPTDTDIHVRMSGMLWPEAAQRIANSAYLTREAMGKGQIILFSGQPNFRGAARGTNRLWLNAVVYGSGLGTDPRVAL